jgi:hypothetical protein
MRAFMSDMWPSGNAPAIAAAEWSGLYVQDFQVAALREARAILAETEPVCSLEDQTMRLDAECAAGTWPGEALAEALAAFVDRA